MTIGFALALALAPQTSTSAADLTDARCVVAISMFGMKDKAKGNVEGEKNAFAITL